MSYRSKKTFVAASGNGNASHNKQPTFVPNSSLETSKLPKHSSPATSQPSKPSSSNTSQPPKPSFPATSQPVNPPFNPSSSKWGPFSPPTPQTSQTFGYIAEPIKKSMAVKNMTRFTLTPSMKPSQSSMPEFPSSQQKPPVRTSNSQSNLLQPTLDTPQQCTEASLQQQGKVELSMASKQWLKFDVSQQQHKSVGPRSNVEATSAPQHPQKMSSTSSQHKEAEFSQKEKQQLLHKHTPTMPPDFGTRPSFEKRVAAASIEATKSEMS